MKYMVMECHPGYAVVMDENGQFWKVANRHYEVGQLVETVTVMQVPKRNLKRRLYPLVAMAACLVLLLTTTFPFFQHPYASVYVKINPEVRIDVDKNDRVVALEGINADGITLIQGYDFRNKNLELVTNELVDLAINAGFLQADGTINLTLDSVDETWVINHSQTLSEHVHTHMQTRFSVTIEVSLHHEDHHVDLPSQATPTELEQNRHDNDHGAWDDDDWEDKDDQDDGDWDNDRHGHGHHDD